MNPFIFHLPTLVHFGADTARQAGEHALRLAQETGTTTKPRALLIADPGIVQARLVERITASLAESGVAWELFSDLAPNPRDTSAQAAAQVFKAQGCQVIVGVGGGSALDTAKAAGMLATSGGECAQYAGWGLVPQPMAPVIAIPTTAGTGSEVTCWAVITDTHTHAKLAIGDRRISPHVALVDPLMTLTLPPGLTAATGMDAMTHAVEAYLCALANPPSSALALEAIRLLATYLPAAFANGADVEARTQVLLGSLLAGMALNNTDVAGVHCLSEALGGLYDAPHGALNAVLLPPFMAYIQADCTDAYAQIAAAMGEPPEPARAVERIANMVAGFHLPSLQALGARRQDLPRIAALAEANVSNPSNPRPMSAADYLVLLEQAFEG